jgi:formylglycine-generating enzyme required for sulfatase activity
MNGNVWEWVEDRWHDSYRGAPSDGTAWTSGDCSRRVLRGDSWYDMPVNLRSANRVGNGRESRVSDVAFRVARTLR